MTTLRITGPAVAMLIVALASCDRPLAPAEDAAPAPPPTLLPAGKSARNDTGFIYGRVTTGDGSYEGRLRWGGDQEAFWSDLFDGHKATNRWAGYAPTDGKEGARISIELFGFEFGGPDRSQFQRRFLARFGDIARIATAFRTVNVTLKSGTVVTLDRFASSDVDDGVRVWDRTRGTVDIDTQRIQLIEFRPTLPLAAAPGRLHGVVHSRQGDFTGFVQWNQQDGVSSDTLDGRTSEKEVNLRYDTIRSIAKHSNGSVMVTLNDGRQLQLSGSRETGTEHRGVYVDDDRYGRVLISWDAFDRVDFSPGGSGPAYEAFAPGVALMGSVTGRDGRRLTGRLVYDFDESETTETFDVSSGGVSYALPFDLIASILPAARDAQGARPAKVVLRDGEELQVDASGDLGSRNAGLLIFVEGRERPEYMAWRDVDRIDLERQTGSGGTGR